MKYFKKIYFFFVDWKTPKGVVNARYVKMNGENVVLEDEKGMQIEVPLDSLDKQNRDLLELAKCFNRTKMKMAKKREWTIYGKFTLEDGTLDYPPIPAVKLHGSLLYEGEDVLVIEADDGRYYLPKKFSTKNTTELRASKVDLQWVDKIQRVFRDKLHKYEAQYDVRLLEPNLAEDD